MPKWWLETVPEDEDGTRLDRFLRRLIPGLPRVMLTDAAVWADPS